MSHEPNAVLNVQSAGEERQHLAPSLILEVSLGLQMGYVQLEISDYIALVSRMRLDTRK